jgi:hypothetical protein
MKRDVNRTPFSDCKMHAFSHLGQRQFINV